MFGTTFRGATVIQSPAADDARRQITLSLRIAVVVPLLFLSLLVLAGFEVFALLVLAGISAYVVWASYWGVVAAMRAVTNLGEREAPEGFLGKFIMKFILEALGLLGMVVVPIMLGILYGTLGGGIREFLNYRRTANNPNLALK
jgi:hypothetical protein